MGKIKLTYTTTVNLEFNSQEDFELAQRNMPWIGQQPGFTSAQSHTRHIECVPVIQLGSVAQAEKIAVMNALADNPTKTAAAKMLGITRATLYNKINQYGITT